ncbi:MAG: Uma2 family endonuclease [Blastochloris sp.]|nr:Uma2 family endonuclease [Blastochloris sp.]
MTTEVIRRTISDEEFIEILRRTNRFEVVDGAVVEAKGMGFIQVYVAGTIYRLLFDFVQANSLGFVMTDGLIYVLERDREAGTRRTRMPDASFVRAGRLPADYDWNDPFRARDLAIEVVSENDPAPELTQRIDDFLTYGSEQVWVIYPELRQLHQFVRGEKVSHIYRENDIFTPGTLFPDLSIVLHDLFDIKRA